MSKSYTSIGWVQCPCGKEGFAYLFKGRLEIKHPVRFGAQATFSLDGAYNLQGFKQKTCYVKKGKIIEQLKTWLTDRRRLDGFKFAATSKVKRALAMMEAGAK